MNQLFSGILLSSAGPQLKQSDWRDLHSARRQRVGGWVMNDAAAVRDLKKQTKNKHWNPLDELN